MGDNTPPVMWLDRNWILSETEPVGSIVTRVRAEDSQFDDLIFGLEPLGHSYNGDDSPQPPLPFSINNETGTIYVNETLKGKVNILRIINNYITKHNQINLIYLLK